MYESGDSQHPATQHNVASVRQPEPENLPCPRCDSTSTKFCYYNNYNLSQPRHFCKSCRRYWTRGGTLRNIPVGGGTRKNSNKRSRTKNISTTPSSSSSTVTFDPLPGNPVSPVPVVKSELVSGSGCSSIFGEVNLNEAVTGSFSTLLGSQQWDGFGLGLSQGLQGLGFGWENLAVDEAGEGNGGASGGGSGCNTWQMGGVEGGLSDGDCFGWPDLSISTPGNIHK